MGKKYSDITDRGGLMKAVGMGIGCSLLTCFILAGFVAWLVITERLGENSVNWSKVLILPISTMLGALVSWYGIRNNRLLITGVHGIVMYLTLLILGLGFGNGFAGLGLNAMLIALGGGMSLIPGLMGSKSGGKKYLKKSFR